MGSRFFALKKILPFIHPMDGKPLPGINPILPTERYRKNDLSFA